jgi:hypothetical protein
MGEIVIQQSKLKMVGLTLLAACMTALTIYLGITQQMRLYFTISGSLLFGAGLLFGVWRLFRPLPALVIGIEGFIDHSSLIGAGFVSWEQVQDIFLHVQTGGRAQKKFISVQITDAAMQDIPAVKRGIMKYNRAVHTSGEINIVLQATNAKYDDVLDVMKRYWEAYRAGHGAGDLAEGEAGSAMQSFG